MAHVHTFGQVAPAAAGIIQYVSGISLLRLLADMHVVLVQRRVMSLSESDFLLQ